MSTHGHGYMLPSATVSQGGLDNEDEEPLIKECS